MGKFPILASPAVFGMEAEPSRGAPLRMITAAGIVSFTGGLKAGQPAGLFLFHPVAV
jgi:hypothetical protein